MKTAKPPPDHPRFRGEERHDPSASGFARRSVILGLPAVVVAASALASCAKNAPPPVGDDMSLGVPTSPVKMVEYASGA